MSEAYINDRLKQHMEIFERISSYDELQSKIMQLGDAIIKALSEGGGVYLCGNGGSAADAQHIAAEFSCRFYKNRAGLNAEALTCNSSALTAIGNDFTFDFLFERQLQAKARKGDVFIAISTSGSSPNIINALKYARSNDIVSVLFTGDKGRLPEEAVADYIIDIPSEVTPRIQEAHIFVGHILAEYVEDKMFPNN